MPQRWQHCAICQATTDYAIVGNRLLSLWNIQRLPSQGTPSLSWRCEQHQHYKLRVPTKVWANEYGDLCFLLTCGHQFHWVLRGRWAYTLAMVAQAVETGQINLEQRHRCYICGDLERERQANP